MRNLSQDTIDLLFNKNLMGEDAQTLIINIGGTINASTEVITGGTNFTNITNFSINKERNAIAQTVNLNLANINPSDPLDSGYYNPLRNDTTHNKPSNAYANIILPGKSIIIQGGYGTDLVTIFTGIIDTVEITIEEKSQLKIVARDNGAKLVDATLKSEILATSTYLYYVTYPIPIGYFISGWLGNKAVKPDPYLWEIFADICFFSGLSTSQIIIEGTLLSSSPSPTELILKVSEVNEDFFIEVKGTANNLCRKIADILNAEFYCDEYGRIHLEPLSAVYEYNDNITLTGTTPESLTVNSTNKDRAIFDSIVVGSGVYTYGDDWEFDEQNNTIVRTIGSDIPSGIPVNIQYSYVNWIFKNGRDIIKPKTTTSHDNYYYKIIAQNKELGLERTITVGNPADGSTLNTNKDFVTDLPELKNNTDLDAWLLNEKNEMRRNYWDMQADVIPLLHLQIYDLVQPLVYGTIQGIYRLFGINLSYKPAYGYRMSITGVFVDNP